MPHSSSFLRPPDRVGSKGLTGGDGTFLGQHIMRCSNILCQPAGYMWAYPHVGSPPGISKAAAATVIPHPPHPANRIALGAVTKPKVLHSHSPNHRPELTHAPKDLKSTTSMICEAASIRWTSLSHLHHQGTTTEAYRNLRASTSITIEHTIPLAQPNSGSAGFKLHLILYTDSLTRCHLSV